MTKLKSLLYDRVKAQQSGKMEELARRSSIGDLSPINSFFSDTPLPLPDREELKELLESYKSEECSIESDYEKLFELTRELHSIGHQGALLHGERIEKAQELLKSYREGAFTAWLLRCYNNRQTPYNFLLYYRFFKEVRPPIKELLDRIPRQAIYTLASREGSLAEKEAMILEYKGEGKAILLAAIRNRFPLKKGDRRASLAKSSLFQKLRSFENELSLAIPRLSPKERLFVETKLKELLTIVDSRS